MTARNKDSILSAQKKMQAKEIAQKVPKLPRKGYDIWLVGRLCVVFGRAIKAEHTLDFAGIICAISWLVCS